MDPKDLMTMTKEEFNELKRVEAEAKKILAEKDAQEKDAIKKEELEKMVNAIVDKIAPKAKPIEFVNDIPEQPEAGKEYKKFGDFMRLVRSGDPAIKTYLSTTGAQGGYNIPQTWVPQIINRINEVSDIYAGLKQVIEVVGSQVNLQSILTDITVSWSTEAATKSETKPTFSTDALSLRFLYAMITQTNEHEVETMLNTENFLMNLVAQNMALEMENQVFNGAAAPFTGLLNAALLANAPIAGANLAYDDLVDCQNNVLMLEFYRKNAMWYLTRNALKIIMKLKDNNGLPIWRLNNPMGGQLSDILGSPYKIATQITDATATGGVTTIYYGDLNSTIFKGRRAGQPDTINVLFSREAVVDNGAGGVTHSYFSQNKSGWRFEKEEGLLVGLLNGMSRLDNVK